MLLIAAVQCYHLLQMPEQNVILRWSAFEHDHVERGADWYVALAIIALCTSLVSLLFHDFFFALVILCAAVTIGMLAYTPSEIIHFEISDKGIRTGDTLHRYNEVISFWVEDEHNGKPLLLVDTKKFMSPNLIIPIEHIDPALVRAYLKERTEEVHMKEPIAHKILEFFGL